MSISRRTALLWAFAATQPLLAACGPGYEPNALPSPAEAGNGSSPAPALAPTASWKAPAIIVLSSNVASYDLSATLPAGMPAGGTFSVDSSGAALPVGIVLSPGGLLTAEPGAAPGPVMGVVFAYDVG